MNCKRNLCVALFVMAVMCAQCVMAADIVDLFVKAPRSVIPLLEQSTRLDMVDYYRSGMSTPSLNVMDGKASVTNMTERTITLNISDASTLQMVLLPVDRKQDVLCCIFTLKTPQPDSWIEFYSTDWTKLDATKFFKEPSVAEWLTKEGKKHAVEIEEQLPFVLASYSCSFNDAGMPAYNKGNCRLIVKNEMAGYFGADQYEKIGQWLKPELVYVWTGKIFQLK